MKIAALSVPDRHVQVVRVGVRVRFRVGVRVSVRGRPDVQRSSLLNPAANGGSGFRFVLGLGLGLGSGLW